MTLELTLLVHAAATLMMAGLIWFVQIVHYPLLAAIDADSVPAYERRHVRRTGPVVGPLMLVEAVSASMLIPLGRDAPLAPLAWIGLALLLIVWCSTILLQIPCHRRLEQQGDSHAIQRLVLTNWIRTAGWSARGLLALLMLGTVLHS